MKKIFNITILAFTLAACGPKDATFVEQKPENIAAFENYVPTTGGADILFNEYEHDFGTVSKEYKQKHIFYFINSGDAPLLITNAKGSCGCTIPFFPEKPIEPGEQGKIEVEIDITNKTPQKVFNVSVRVESNAKNDLVKLKLKGIPTE